MVHQPHLNTRTVSFVMLAALAAAGVWLFVPWGSMNGGSSSGSGGSSAGSAATSSLKTDGASEIQLQGNVIAHLVVPITTDSPVGIRLLDQDGTLRAETSLSETAAAAVPGTYALHRLDGNGDDVLDAGEHAELIVELPATSSVHPGNPLRFVVTTADGQLLPVEDVIR